MRDTKRRDGMLGKHRVVLLEVGPVRFPIGKGGVTDACGGAGGHRAVAGAAEGGAFGACCVEDVGSVACCAGVGVAMATRSS